MPKPIPKACPDCQTKVDSLLDLLVHYENCPSTKVQIIIGITENGTVFSYPEFSQSSDFPDLASLLRFMADKVKPA